MFVHRIGELRDEFPAAEGGEVVGTYICRVCQQQAYEVFAARLG